MPTIIHRFKNIMLSMKQCQTSYSQFTYAFNIFLTGHYKQAVTKLNGTSYLRPALQYNNGLGKKHNIVASVPRLPTAVTQCPSQSSSPDTKQSRILHTTIRFTLLSQRTRKLNTVLLPGLSQLRDSPRQIHETTSRNTIRINNGLA